MPTLVVGMPWLGKHGHASVVMAPSMAPIWYDSRANNH